VDNPPSPLSQIFFFPPSLTTTSAFHAACPDIFVKILIRDDPRKSVATLFLKCTKNTELTPLRFARTFGLALLPKMRTNSVEDSNRPET